MWRVFFFVVDPCFNFPSPFLFGIRHLFQFGQPCRCLEFGLI